MIELGIILLSSLILCVTWIYRGGSLHWDWLPNLHRFFDLLVTPFFVGLALAAAAWPLSFIQIGLLILGIAIFTGAQAPGWGRQMDLGRDPGRDDEWGWQIRDFIFGKEKPVINEDGTQPVDWKGRPMYHGNFYRDLTGLYMRFAWFLLAAIPFFFVHPLMSIVPIVLFIGGPLVWVREYKLFSKYGNYGTVELYEAIMKQTPIGTSWVEFWTSILIAVTTLMVSLAIFIL
jgi:hypothetical protein